MPEEAMCRHSKGEQALVMVYTWCAENEADALLVTALDEVAWFLNLRGSDVSYNPVFLSYVMVTADDATLYVDEQKASSPSMLLLFPLPPCLAVLSVCKCPESQPQVAG